MDFQATGIQMICKAMMLSAQRVLREQCGAKEDKESTLGAPHKRAGRRGGIIRHLCQRLRETLRQKRGRGTPV